MKQTPFYQSHRKSNAKIVDFGGWALPVNYSSQIDEHLAVRTDAGMFDVSHMLITDILGKDAKAFLQKLLSNDVAKLEKSGIGKALYSGMLNANACVIDDLIVYLMPFGYRMVTNAATEAKDVAWLSQVAKNYNVTLNKRRDLAMLAVQGPNAIAKVGTIHPDIEYQLQNLKPFMAIDNGDFFYARTGYTGENGLEIILKPHLAADFWDKLCSAGVKPCGLGARDTLRLEAGMNLYGHDMDEEITPLACNMDWVVDLTDSNRNFIGKEAYLSAKANAVSDTQVGLILDGKGVLREGQKLFSNNQHCGTITSGTFSPSLKVSIAMARVKKDCQESLTVDIRGNHQKVRIFSLPFIRNGKVLVTI